MLLVILKEVMESLYIESVLFMIKWTKTDSVVASMLLSNSSVQ